ncbi:phage tail protein [Escherichia coli]
MATKYFALLTNVGAAKLANATALGAQVEITQMAVGDGNGVLPTPNPAKTALTHELRRAQLNMLTIDPVNTNQIIAEQVIPEDVGGWWIREIGLFDKDGDMIAVANCAETYKPKLQEGSGRVQVIRVILIVSSTEAVTLKIDPSVVLATRKYVDDAVIEVKAYADDVMKKHVASANPHKQYPLIANALKEMVDDGLVNQVLQNLGLGTASKRNVGTGENQIPDMGAFASGSGWFRLPGGYIVQFGTFSGNTTRFISGHFPIPFPNQPMVSVSVMSDAVQSDPSNPAPQVLSVNFEHISNSAWRVATSDISQQYRFSYISIGR